MPTKSLQCRFSPLAEHDLEDIWLYTYRQWSLEQADAYHLSFIQTIEGLACGRHIPQKSDARAGYWKYPVGKHRIFFRMSGRFLDVMRILHETMDVEQHLERRD